MFEIRKEQMEVLGRHELEKFVVRMMAHLREDFADYVQPMSDEQLREFVETGIATSKTYEVVDEDDVCIYIECMAVYGRDFDTNPKTDWAGSILRQTDLDGFEKMKRVLDGALFRAGE